MTLGFVDMFAEVGVVAGAFVAVFTAVVMAVRKLHQMGQWLANVNDIVDRELKHNGGQSIKDQVHTVHDKLDAAKIELAHLQRTVDDHLGDVEAHASDPTAHIRPSNPDSGWAGPR